MGLQKCFPFIGYLSQFNLILFSSKTMVSSDRAKEVFTKLLRYWELCATDSVGQLGGLLSPWNPRKANLVPYVFATRILLEGSLKD